MANLYHAVKQLPRTFLMERGFQSDKLNEGFYKEKTDGVTVIFHITGMWSHVEIHAGVRFKHVNEMLYHSALRAGWSKSRASMFRLELVGMFREKIGDYCESVDDIGEYCPEGSSLASLSDICELVLKETDRLSSVSNIDDSLGYTCKRSLFEPFGAYMIPAAAKISDNKGVWDWSVRHFTDLMPDTDRLQYRALLNSLESE